MCVCVWYFGGSSAAALLRFVLSLLPANQIVCLTTKAFFLLLRRRLRCLGSLLTTDGAKNTQLLLDNDNAQRRSRQTDRQRGTETDIRRQRERQTIDRRESDFFRRVFCACSALRRCNKFHVLSSSASSTSLCSPSSSSHSPD